MPWAVKDNKNQQEVYFYLLGPSAKQANKRPPLHDYDVAKLSEPSKAKLDKIEELLTLRLKNPAAVHEKIKRIINVRIAQPQHQYWAVLS